MLAFALGQRGDALVILVVVIVNALIGTFQEGRAERSMEALRRLSALQVRVLRPGSESWCRRASSCPATSCCSPRAMRSPPMRA